MRDTWARPGTPGQDPDVMAADPTARGYPLCEYIVQDTPPVVPIARGVRTQVPLATGTPTSGRAFSDYSQPRLDAAQSRLKPTSADEVLHIRFTLKIVRDPAQTLVQSGLNLLVNTLSGIAGVDSGFLSPQAAIVEADGGSTYGPFFQDTAPLVVLPQLITMTFLASGATAFLTNGCRFYITLTVPGLAITDPRVFLSQAR